MATIAPPPVLYTIPVLVDSKVNLENSGVLIPDGMLAKVAGDSRFKVGEGDKTWNELDFVQPDSIQLGGGLATDAQGKIYVDFSQMPTDKFEKLVQSIRVPIWLSANTNFYVDGATGSDVLDTGRGLSADKAFKTIQACVNYVTSSYNIDNYNVNIYCNKVKGSKVILPNYSFNTGYITICKSPACTDEYGLELVFEPTQVYTGGTIDVKAGKWRLYDCKASFSTKNKPALPRDNNMCLWICEGSNMYISHCDFTFYQYNTDWEWNNTLIYISGAKLTIADNIKLHLPKQNIVNVRIDTTAIGVGTDAYINYSLNDISKYLKIDGICQYTLYVNGGTFALGGGNANSLNCDTSELTATTSVNVIGGGKVSVLGKGNKYFGDAPISVESDTYSWYK